MTSRTGRGVGASYVVVIVPSIRRPRAGPVDRASVSPCTESLDLDGRVSTAGSA